MTLFHKYKHSKAIIYSHLEQMYPYYLYEDTEFNVLFTEFDYHYFEGNPPGISILKNTIKDYITTHDKNEIILFGPNEEWEIPLEQLTKEINGVIDIRYSYSLNKEVFLEHYQNHHFIHHVHFIKETEPNATKESITACIYDNNKIVSYAKGFMIGQSNVEIDVFTEETHRQKHMAYECLLHLTKNLIEQDLIPNYNVWEKKIQSQKLAQKCGFQYEQQYNAYIWVKEFGDF